MATKEIWTPKYLEERLRACIQHFGLDRMPKKHEMREFCGTAALEYAVAKYGGVKHWAVTLGVNDSNGKPIENTDKQKVDMATEADILRAKEAKEAERKYLEQCKAGELITYKMDPKDLEKYKSKKTDEKIPSMINVENLVRKEHKSEQPTIQATTLRKQREGGIRVKKLKIEQMIIKGEVLNYIKKENTVSLVNGNISVRVKTEDLPKLIDELQELKEMVANG